LTKENHNHELQTLLDLDGEVFPMDNGYWTKFEARIVEPHQNRPHGVKYSLTLHGKNNERIIGFDNAHGVKPNRKKFGAKKTSWDHKHKRNIITQYEFNDASQLLEDFWAEIDRFFEEI